MALLHFLGDFLIEQGGAGLGKLALFHQGRGPVVSSLKVVHNVARVR